jgi:hypothetical protein
MKRILTLISILIIAYSLNAQELKGVYLGSYTKISQTNPRIVSLVYEDYILSTFNTKAGKVAIITAIPYERDTRGIRLIKFKEVSGLPRPIINDLASKAIFVDPKDSRPFTVGGGGGAASGGGNTTLGPAAANGGGAGGGPGGTPGSAGNAPGAALTYPNSAFGFGQSLGVGGAPVGTNPTGFGNPGLPGSAGGLLIFENNGT